MRQRENLIQDCAKVLPGARGLSLAGRHRRLAVPGGELLFDRLRFARQLDDACVVVGVEALVTAQDVGGLSDRETEVRPVE